MVSYEMFSYSANIHIFPVINVRSSGFQPNFSHFPIAMIWFFEKNVLTLQNIPEGTSVSSDFLRVHFIKNLALAPMLDKTKLKDFIEGQLKDTDCFLTDLSVTPTNEVRVEIDSDSSVDLDFCIDLNRAIEQEFPTDEEDYELEVGSAGLTSPLKIPRQYRKYIGQDLEVFASDSKKYCGLLVSADDDGIVLRFNQKVKKEGQKRPVEEVVEKSFPYSEIRKAVYDLKF